MLVDPKVVLGPRWGACSRFKYRGSFAEYTLRERLAAAPTYVRYLNPRLSVCTTRLQIHIRNLQLVSRRGARPGMPRPSGAREAVTGDDFS